MELPIKGIFKKKKLPIKGKANQIRFSQATLFSRGN